MTSGAPSEDDLLRERVRARLRDVIDPEVGLNIVDLGLVYGVEVQGGEVTVQLTMTTPACPLGDQIVEDARDRISDEVGVVAVHVDLVWEPPWSPERMSPEARQTLGWSG
ncbi:MAG: metal-sulfur cluster assembly factor [Polyangiaceae bacterium]|nr:metal-sulfur cluster assembly factor [Polyangiaceae bacterium]